MLRARLVSEPAQVDDPADPLALRHLREVPCRLALPLLEVALAAPSHPVDQVVGDLRPVPGAPERIGVQDVPLEELDAAIGEVPRPPAVANQGTDVPAVIGQGVGQPARR